MVKWENESISSEDGSLEDGLSEDDVGNQEYLGSLPNSALETVS
jgi:hypothetical protein